MRFPDPSRRLLAVVVAAAAGALSVLISWYYQPYLAGTTSRTSPRATRPCHLTRHPRGRIRRLDAGSLRDRRLAGILIRQVVPAIVATLAAYTGLALVAANLLRQHYLTPLVTSSPNVSGSAWLVSQWWTKGRQVRVRRPPPQDLLMQLCPNAPARVFGKPSHGTVVQCLS